MSGRTFIKWFMITTILGVVLVVGCVVAVIVAIDSADDSGSTPTNPGTSSRYTHHNCVKVVNRNLYNGVNTRVRRLRQPFNPDRCTDILSEDGRRHFNIAPSQIERLIQYR